MFLNQPVSQENKFWNFNIYFFSILNTKQTNDGVFSNKAGENLNLTKMRVFNHHVKASLEEFEHDAAIIHVGINYILRSKGEKEVNGNLENYQYSWHLSKL